MKLLSALLSALALTSTSAFAEPFAITVQNAGSKTGSFAQQSIAYSQDLESLGYTVTLDIPDNHCIGAAKAIQAQEPVLVPWASDYEAEGRYLGGCITVDVPQAQVIRFDRNVLHVCTLNSSRNEFDTTSGRLGGSLPQTLLDRAMNVVNKHFGVEHRTIRYNGSGDLKTAMFNGEIDYALLSLKHAKDATSRGASCFYTFGDQLIDNTENLITIVGNEHEDVLTIGYDAVWLALNMSDKQVAQLRNDVRGLHTDSNSAIFNYTDGDKNVTPVWELTSEESAAKFEQSVQALKAQ